MRNTDVNANISVGVGMACNNTNQCIDYIVNSQCDGGQCLCQADYQPDSSMLQCVAKVCPRNSACYTTSCCQLADKYSICDTTSATSTVGSCTCAAGYVPSVGSGPCTKKYLINDFCSSSIQCSTVMAGSACSGSPGQCACVAGYKTLNDLSGCVRLPLAQVSWSYCFT
jgi:hypothetical protein